VAPLLIPHGYTANVTSRLWLRGIAQLVRYFSNPSVYSFAKYASFILMLLEKVNKHAYSKGTQPPGGLLTLPRSSVLTKTQSVRQFHPGKLPVKKSVLSIDPVISGTIAETTRGNPAQLSSTIVLPEMSFHQSQIHASLVVGSTD